MTTRGAAAARSHGQGGYQKVLDSRKRPVRGLWIRNGRYYAQMRVELPSGHKVPRRIALEARNLAGAQKEKLQLDARRDKGKLPRPQRSPTLSMAIADYLEHLGKLSKARREDAKRLSTIGKERQHLKRWDAFMGGVRLDKVSKARVMEYAGDLMARGRTGRTADLHVITLRNVLNHAIDRDQLAEMPLRNLRRFGAPSPKRQLVDTPEIDRLCEAVPRVLRRRGEALLDLIRLLQYSGMRVGEATRSRWEDVDFAHGQLQVGNRGDTKNRKSRVVDFNTSLEGHLKDMHGRRQPDSAYLFPSPRRGLQDFPISYPASLINQVTREAGLPPTRFHDLRHHFISQCVMTGVDYMTIARWVGHQDGGILIGRVYGHLSSDHARRQAARLEL